MRQALRDACGYPCSFVRIGAAFSSDLPARLDRLPWSPWHWRVVVALGITWILDGLEVTIVGAVAGVLQEADTLHLSETQVGAAASAYLGGAIVGALLFGRLTDVYGRKRLFLVTLGLYLVATLLTAAAWDAVSFYLFRALTGAGIGGECAAMNSAIDELVPARVRGRVDLTINGTYWVGTALGSASTLVLLDARVMPHAVGWRVTFGLGALLGIAILLVRRHLPESPRWLLSHGRVVEAERVVADIERQVADALLARGRGPLPVAGPVRPLLVTGSATFSTIVRVLTRRHLRRTVLGLSLMIAQAFAYNAIFFTYALVLGRFYGVPADRVGLYLLPFAIGNWLGPMILGRLFDTIGRRAMIAGTYGLAGLLLAATGYAFAQGWLTAVSQTALWCAVFFVASAAASSAYLTVSELFPVELRGMAIALFYSTGTLVGGLAAPALFAALIHSGSRSQVAEGYALGAALMIAAAVVAGWLGVAAEGKSLEQIAG
jgi:MFS family permease